MSYLVLTLVTFVLSTFMIESCFAQEMVLDLARSGSSAPHNFIGYDEGLYFSANDGIHDFELWTYTPKSGASLVANIKEQFGSRPNNFAVFNGKLYFQADGDTSTGTELWEYDGINPPRLLDIRQGGESSVPRNLFVYRDTLYFSALDGINGSELWRYDGINEPQLFADLNQTNSNSSGSVPADFTVFNGELFFSGYEGNNRVMWRYDGKSRPEKAFNHENRTWSDPAHLIVFDGRLLFSAREFSGERAELWSYDGTGLPTAVVTNMSHHHRESPAHNHRPSRPTRRQGQALTRQWCKWCGSFPRPSHLSSSHRCSSRCGWWGRSW